jgi:molybdopterin converting factor small subunit
MRVLIPSALRSYTDHGMWAQAEGVTLDALLADLDRRHPGIRFRMVDEQDRLRPHMRVFVNGLAIKDLAHPIAPGDEVAVVQALSGG